MKQCPQCRQTFSDETLFCLSDGTPLAFIGENPEEITVVRPIPNIPIPNIQPSQPVKQGVSPIFAYLTVILLILMLGGGIILAAIFAISRMSNTNTNNNTETARVSNNLPSNFLPANKVNGDNKLDEQKANLQQQQDQIEKEKQRLTDERKKLNEEKNKPVETPPPVPTPPPSYPQQPTARIKFGRGRIAETVSGTVNSQRSFVLECRNGQYLSASVSGGGCVVFSNGSASIGYVTNSGDNRLTLVNNCNSPSGFNMTVTIR